VITLRINNLTFQAMRFAVVNIFVYQTLYTFMCKFEPHHFFLAVNGAVFAAGMVAQGTFLSNAMVLIGGLLGMDLSSLLGGEEDEDEKLELPPDKKVPMRRDKPIITQYI